MATRSATGTVSRWFRLNRMRASLQPPVQIPPQAAATQATAADTIRHPAAVDTSDAPHAEILRACADLVEEVVSRGLQGARKAGWLAEGDCEIERALATALRNAVGQGLARHFCGAARAQLARRLVAQHCQRLHAEDLALVAACAAGYEPAWNFFLERYRPALRRAARAMAGANSCEGEELADSLWAELYGIRDSTSVRRPLLDYYHGRSSLLTWLRAVLAQRYVDWWRAARRAQPLERDETGPPASWPSAAPAADELPEPDRVELVARFERALRAALASLTPRDRLCLAYYYLHELTLAEIGRLLAEHEATVSRRLERVRRQIRTAVENSFSREFAARSGSAPLGWLRRKQLCEQQVQLCLEYALQDGSFDLAALLAVPTAEAELASRSSESGRKKFAPLRSMLRSRT
jgi:RNA polymerase sigma-70 factor (ECF subfamily)